MADQFQSWIVALRERLASPPSRRLPASDLRPASVLVPLYVDAGELWTVLTKRTDTLPSHRSQIAFPGGGRELKEDPWGAALRETHTDSYAAVRGHVDDADASHVTLVPGLHDRPQRIDHVFAQAGALVPERANRILDRAGADGTWPSDHFGVWVRLRFVETAQAR